MARWEPGARSRLQAAALELYVKQGYEQTTVEGIARAVGLTERTFFRHFADKREVLFDGAGTAGCGCSSTPWPRRPPTRHRWTSPPRPWRARRRSSPSDRRHWSRERQAVITANPALKERELLKMAALAGSIADALRAAVSPTAPPSSRRSPA